MNNQILFFGTILLTAILGLVLGAVSLSFRELIKKYYNLKEELGNEEKDLRAKEEKATQEAKIIADQIIQQAQGRAQTIINEAAIFSSHSKDEFSVEVKKATVAQLSNFQSVLSVAEKEVGQAFGNISENIKVELEKEMQTLRTSLAEEIIRSQGVAKKTVEEAYKKVDMEIDAYKELRKRQIDERIFEILTDIVTKVSGKSLKLEDHEDLVISALEEAKRQNAL